MKAILLSIFLLFLFIHPAAANYCLNADKGFKTNAVIKEYLSDMVTYSSGFAAIKVIGVSTNAGQPASEEINAILISENASWDNKTKPTVVITSAIHGNEWATPEVAIGIAEYLLENKDNADPALDDKGSLINEYVIKATSDPKNNPIVPKTTSIQELLTKIQVIIIPVLNPAGYDFSRTPAGRNSYYGAGWRPNRRLLGSETGQDQETCYKRDGEAYQSAPNDSEHCFLADYEQDPATDELFEEEILICESLDKKNIYLFESSNSVASKKMFEAVYDSRDPKRVICATNQRRVWKESWESEDSVNFDINQAKADGYLQNAYGTDLNRNFQYKWDMVAGQEHLFIRSRTPYSRVYRGEKVTSEAETTAMEFLVETKNIVALIDYHAGSTQVLYPYAYSTEKRVENKFLSNKLGREDLSDFYIFKNISKKIVNILNRHDRGNESIINYTAAQNYNGNNVGSGVARDCYYEKEQIAALNIEVHDRRYTYEDEEFNTVVPDICRTNVPGAVWFLFWAAELDKN